jgi:hypothetical protein
MVWLVLVEWLGVTGKRAWCTLIANPAAGRLNLVLESHPFMSRPWLYGDPPVRPSLLVQSSFRDSSRTPID